MESERKIWGNETRVWLGALWVGQEYLTSFIKEIISKTKEILIDSYP